MIKMIAVWSLKQWC